MDMSALQALPRLLLTIGMAIVFSAAGAMAADESDMTGKRRPGSILPNPVKGKIGSALSGSTLSPPDKITAVPAVDCRPFTISAPRQLPSGALQQNYLFRIPTSGGVAPVSFSLVRQHHLPPGLKLATNGLIAGVPQEPGTYTFTIAVFDTCQQGSRRMEKPFVIVINDAMPSVMMPETALSRPALNNPTVEGGLNLTHLTLAFVGGNARIVVAKDKKVPALVAHFQLQGSGVIAGYWVTPDREKLFFKKRVSAPEATLTFPANDALPTDVPGQHAIRMVLTSPKKTLPGAVASYVVMRETLPPKDAIPRQLVVSVDLKSKDRFASNLSPRYGLRLRESYVLTSLAYAILVFETDGDIVALAEQIDREPGVMMAQPNHVFHTLSEPKDALQSLSRQLRFSKIHDFSRGRGVTVAIIDTGVDVDHEDLQANIRGAENFIPGESYHAEIHGTAVAGIIAAGINHNGIAGVAPESKILALRACKQVSETDPQGRGNSVSIARAIDVALVHKVGIVNMSFGSGTSDRLITRLVEAGAHRGILFVAPVGNREGLSVPIFPASLERVIAVGGVRENGEAFPNPALAAAAAVCAPCEHLFTTIPGNRYNFLDGTSISAAVVSGVLALALEKRRVLRKEDLPSTSSDIRIWTETLLGIPLSE
jgi:hypothetical protein